MDVGALVMRMVLFLALMLSLVTIDIAPDLRRASERRWMRRLMFAAMIYLLESSQYECLVRVAFAEASMGWGPLTGGV